VARVAVVTGAARGLGQAISDRLAGDGYDVVYADLDPKGAEAAASVTGSLAVELDIRELGSVEACLAAAVDRHGGVDVWVNNAART
jgi:3-oxoacyl-[acyl-carrier protein] reductase